MKRISFSLCKINQMFCLPTEINLDRYKENEKSESYFRLVEIVRQLLCLD